MIAKLSTVITHNTVPYQNLALEELLLREAEEDECILYLWQNRNTVVLGRNQNCYAECRADALLQDSGFVVRRLSGGGAVFHDLGNLNFTFLMRSENYDIDRQLEVILRAVQSFGIAAEKSGRNDITANGAKFSGNAFYRADDCRYHHGTLLLHVDTALLSRYLTVSADKLSANGVQSVHARVVNLCDLSDKITVPRMRDALIAAFSQVYGLPSAPLPSARVDRARIIALTQKFSSREWIFGHEPDSACVLRHRFSWGGAELRLSVASGIIKNAVLYTDAMDAALSPVLCGILIGSEFSASGVAQAFRRSAAKPSSESAALFGILAELAAFMEEWFYAETI
ncbi:MAG: lipoate--protein ligase [Ruthenibacterium sp.]